MWVVIWDVDNTLYDYQTIDQLSTQHVLDTIVSKFDPVSSTCFKSTFDQIISKIRNPDSQLHHLHHQKHFYWKLTFQTCRFPFTLSELSTYSQLYEQTFLKLLDQPFDGVKECLQLILDRGGKNIAISNNSYRYQIERLQKSGLHSYFTNVFCQDEMGFSKPDSRVWTYLESILRPEDQIVVYIGDSLKEDISFALEKNIPTIFWKHTGQFHNDDVFSSNYQFKHSKVYRFTCYQDLLPQLQNHWIQ